MTEQPWLPDPACCQFANRSRTATPEQAKRAGDAATLGDRIRGARALAGLTQAGLAHPDLSDSYLSLVECGKRIPSSAVVDLLAHRLQCCPDYLLHGAHERDRLRADQASEQARRLMESGNADQALLLFQEVLGSPVTAHLPSLRFGTSMALAEAYKHRGDIGSAVALLHDLAGRLTTKADAARRIEVLVALCRCLHMRGHLTQAIAIGEPALDDLRAHDQQWSEAALELAATLSGIYLARGDRLKAAIAFTDDLPEIAAQIDTPRAQIAAHRILAASLHARGDHTGAFHALGLALKSNDGRVSSRETALLRLDHAAAALHNGQVGSGHMRTALTLLLRAANELDASGGSPREEAIAELYMSHAECALGHSEAAARRATQLLQRADLPPPLRCQAHITLGRALLAGQPDNAPVAAFRAAANVLRQWQESLLQPDETAGAVWAQIADGLARAGDVPASLRAHANAFAALHL